MIHIIRFASKFLLLALLLTPLTVLADPNLSRPDAIKTIMADLDNPKPTPATGITGKKETDKQIDKITRPRIYSTPFRGSTAKKYDAVGNLIEQRIPTDTIKDAASFAAFFKKPAKPSRDRGVDSPNDIWDKIKAFVTNPERFNYWADVSPVTAMSCLCDCTSLLGNFPASMWEYWFPYAVVEITEQPLETAFISKADIKTLIDKQLNSNIQNPYMTGTTGNSSGLFEKWTTGGYSRVKTVLDQYAPKIIPNFNATIAPAPDRTPIAMALDAIKGMSAPDLPDGSKGPDWSRFRNPMSTSGLSYTEFHVIPMRADISDSLRKSHPQFCHWRLDPGKANPLDPDVPPVGAGKTDPSLVTSSQQLFGSSTFVGSDMPTGALDLARDPTANLLMFGRDRIRVPSTTDHYEYDAQKPGGDEAFFKSFFNAGTPHLMYMKQIQNPLTCPQLNMAAFDTSGQPRSVSNPKFNTFHTPEDILPPVWSADTTTAQDPELVAKSGCLQGNLGPWIPTRNFVSQSYHATAAQVAAIRALKLAYYLHPPDSECKGDLTAAPSDQWGGIAGGKPCYIPFKDGGHYYDFNPFPYADSHAVHPYSQEVVWQPASSAASTKPGVPNTFGGDFNRVADKIQWYEGGMMPRNPGDLDRTPAHTQRDIIAIEEKSALGVAPGKAGDDKTTRAKLTQWDQREIVDGPDGKEVRGPHHIAIAWRFFRTCPKSPLPFTGFDGSACCTPCLPAIDDEAATCECPLEKKL